MSDETLEATPVAPESEPTTSPEPENNESSGAEEQPEKTFTQSELEKIIGERVAKAERKLRREMQQAAVEAPKPTVDGPPQMQDYASPEDFLEAAAEWKANQKLAEREAIRHQQTVQNTFAEREEEARAKYEDYESVAYADDLRITEYMAEVIKASEIGPEIAYHLGSNPKEAERIAKMTPLAQARELGKIEASLESGAPAPVKKVSSAPNPIKPVGSRSSSAPVYDTTDPRSIKSMTTSEWIEAERKRQMKRYS